MVIFFEWQRKEMDLKNSGGLPLTGEDAGLRASASPLAGYLGKVQERAASLEFCPWCTSKGLKSPLRSYRINLQESITLCTNPQCLFPLVSRSLEDVLASLVPVEATVGCKRKTSVALEKDELIKPVTKRLRLSHQESLREQSVTESRAEQDEHDEGAAVNTNGQHAESVKTNGYKDTETGWEALQENALDEEPEKSTCTDCFYSVCFTSPQSDTLLTAEEKKDDFRQVKNPPETLNRSCSQDSNSSLSTDKDIHSTEINNPSPQRKEVTAKIEQRSQTADDRGGEKSERDKTESEELVAASTELFWRNSHSLCWLDSLLVALVNCKTLRKMFKSKEEPARSSVWQLLRQYEDVCAAFKERQQTGGDGVVRVHKHVQQKAFEDLQSLRMSIFKLLQPKLQCKLGHWETPVFAMPLLLSMDSWAEPLFQSSFHWEFKCGECKAESTESVIKPLPTLTNLLPDWHPLHAVQLAPCNFCCKKNQRRTMVLESLSPVFALHFVEGLPNNNVQIYSFTFRRKKYSISTIIQYKQHLKHFVTWRQNPDGSWTEFDDLNHPDIRTHQNLSVPAQEMHLVLWEVEEERDPEACSPSSTITDPPLVNSITYTTDQSMITPHNDTDIVCALSLTENSSSIMDKTITDGLNASIGSTTLLDAFEGLSHNDIITLTLVEIQQGSEPLNPNQENQDGRNIVNVSTPDSSTLIENENPQAVDTDPQTPSSESEKGSSSDPSFVPASCGGRRRTRGKSVRKKAAPSKKAPPVPASSEPPRATKRRPAKANPPPVENTKQASPVSSTDKSDNPKTPLPFDQNARWSFLLSKHPVIQIPRPPLKPVPSLVAPVKKPPPPAPAAPPAHSTPNPVKKQPISGGGIFPKLPLKLEKSEGLPVKAAEMYGAFGVKSSYTPSPLSSPAPLNHKPTFNPILMNSTVMSGASLPVSGVPEMCSSKKRSSKVPPGLNATEALRYKLIKKLKAKKKKLAKLNHLLGGQGGASLLPDSSGLRSPNSITSSTYDGSSVCDDFLSDLLSPATTVSNLSPDSTGFLEMLAKGPDGADKLDMASQMTTFVDEPGRDNFLEDFLTQAASQRPTDEETEALSALEYFM